MNQDFIKSKNLKKFEKEMKETELQPHIPTMKKDIKGKKYEIFFLKNKTEITGGSLIYEKRDKTPHIYFLFIKKEHRKKGYSKKLLEYIIYYLRKKKYNKITCSVKISNRRMIIPLLSYGFQISGYNFILNRLILHKSLLHFKKRESNLFNLLLENNIDEKKKLLAEILMGPTNYIDELNNLDLKNLDADSLSPLNRFRYLRSIADSNSLNGVKAMEKLSKNVDEVALLECPLERLKILKFIAIHAEKKFSEKAIEKLYGNLSEINKLKNSELKASFLRYLIFHLRGKKREKVRRLLKKIDNQKVKNTSLNYLSIYNKNE